MAPAKDPAEVAADKAVSRVFFLLGVDVDDAASVEEFRQDLRFGKSLRKHAERGTAAMLNVVAMLLFGSIVWAIQNRFHQIGSGK